MTASRAPGPGRLRPAALVAAALAPLLATGAGAQELSGVALGPDGGPLVGAVVLLHRVGGGGGAMAGVDTTGTAGEFGFSLPARDSAVFFAAVRYEGGLYIGPPARAGEPVTGYVLQVGPESEVGALGAALSGPAGAMPPAAGAPARPGPARPGSSDTGALWLVALLALAAAGLFVYTAPRYRERRTLDAVMEVASIENRLADAGELSPEQRQGLESRRDRLKEQLAPGD